MNPEKRNEDFLREASALGDEDGVRKLLEAGVDVNSQHSINGWTALHWAAKRGHPSIVRLLLSQGADSSLTSVYGELPIAVAKNEDIHNILSGNSETQTEFQAKASLAITPNYLANPALVPKIEKTEKQNTEVSYSNYYANCDSKRKLEEEIVLKVRVAESIDPDFIEVEVPLKELTYENICRICCEELEVPPRNVLKLRKLPNTVVRKDKDVLRFQNFQELELVLKPNGLTRQQPIKTHFNDSFYQECNNYTNNGSSIDNNSDTSSPLVKKSNYCKNGTILY